MFLLIVIVWVLFLNRLLEKCPSFVGHLYTIIMVMIGWVIFAIEDLDVLGGYLGVMFGFGSVPVWDSTALYYLGSYLIVLFVAAVASTPLAAKAYNALPSRLSRGAGLALLAAGLVICTAYLVAGTYNPFLYFRF